MYPYTVYDERMTLRSDREDLHFTPMSQDEVRQLRQRLEAQTLRGGETGAIAAEMLDINDKLTGMIEKIKAFLKD